MLGVEGAAEERLEGVGSSTWGLGARGVGSGEEDGVSLHPADPPSALTLGQTRTTAGTQARWALSHSWP